MQDKKQKNVTIVLVHAAWADGSRSDDVAALRRVLRRQERPVILVGHSYGGAVITAAGAGNPNVKALVFVAAVVPDEGETVGDVFHRVAPHPSAPQLQPDEDGLLWLRIDAFRNAVAPDASAEETALMAATQKPIALKCLGEPMTKPAWKEKPSWFLIAEKDRMVSSETQRYTAKRMRSRIVSLPVDHSPLISQPKSVADLIQEAAASF